MEPETEAHGPAFLVQGLAVNRQPLGRKRLHEVAARRPHYANLFAVMRATRQSRARAGPRYVEGYVFPSYRREMAQGPDLERGCFGRGVIFLLRDAREADPGADDKTPLIEETEFGGVLDIIKREGNELSAILRAVGTVSRWTIGTEESGREKSLHACEQLPPVNERSYYPRDLRKQALRATRRLTAGEPNPCGCSRSGARLYRSGASSRRANYGGDFRT